MQNRRNFLKQASLMLAGGLVAPQLLSSCGGKSGQAAATASESSKYIGLQLYSLRDLVKEEGIQKVLETAAKMGYKNLETASYDNGKIYGLAPAEFKKMVNDLGMKCTSAHLGQAFTKEKEAEVMSWWDQAIDAHNELGVKYMVQPWMPVNDKTTLDDLKMYCDYFNTVGYKTAAASIAFGYHNHDFEFTKLDGKYALDILYEEVPASLLQTELDTCWVNVGGEDPVAYLTKYSGRAPVLHLKDFVGSKSENMYKLIGIDDKEKSEENEKFAFRPVGYGKQDFPKILAAAEPAGVQWVVVEQDQPTKENTPMECAEMSRKYLKSIGC